MIYETEKISRMFKKSPTKDWLPFNKPMRYNYNQNYMELFKFLESKYSTHFNYLGSYHYLDNYGKLLDKWDSVLAEKGVKKINISNDVINAFRAKAADPIRDAWIADMEKQGLPGQELYDLVQSTLAKAKAGN